MRLELITKVNDQTPLTYTEEGYGVVNARVSRTGILDYMGYELGGQPFDFDQRVRLYRPPEEVGAVDSLATFQHKPVTVLHPFDDVVLSNWKDHAVGEMSTDAAFDGEYVDVTLWLKDPAAIAAVIEGNVELSLGYSFLLDNTPGTTPDGEAYDAIQRDIQINHCAIVKTGRCGFQCRILVSQDAAAKPRHQLCVVHSRDSASAVPPTSTSKKETPMTEKTNQLVSVKLGDTRVSLDATTAKDVETAFDAVKAAADQRVADAETAHTAVVEAKDAELETANSKIAELEASVTDEAIESRVAERQAIIDAASNAGVTLETKGVSDRDLRIAVLKDKMPDKDYAEADDAVIAAAFDVATTVASAPKHPLAGQNVKDTATSTDLTSVQDAGQATQKSAFSSSRLAAK